MVIGSGGHLITRITQEAESDLTKIFVREVRLKISAKLRKWGRQFGWCRSEPDPCRGIRKPEKSEEIDMNSKLAVSFGYTVRLNSTDLPHSCKMKCKYITGTLHGFSVSFQWDYDRLDHICLCRLHILLILIYKYVFIIINAKNHIVLHSYIDIHVCSEGKVHVHSFTGRKGLPCFLLFIVFSVVRLLSVVQSCCLTECLA